MLSSEGDHFYKRSKENHKFFLETYDKYQVIDSIEQLDLQPKILLEIGYSDGWRLKKINQKYNSYCCGIDPSFLALSEGEKTVSYSFIATGHC